MGLTSTGKRYAAYVLCGQGGGYKLALGTGESSPLTPGDNNYSHIPIVWGVPVQSATDTRSTAYMNYDIETDTLSNANDIYFPDAEGGSWGLITHLFILSSDNYILYAGELTNQVTISENRRPKFAAGSIQITFS